MIFFSVCVIFFVLSSAVAVTASEYMVLVAYHLLDGTCWFGCCWIVTAQCISALTTRGLCKMVILSLIYFTLRGYVNILGIY